MVGELGMRCGRFVVLFATGIVLGAPLGTAQQEHAAATQYSVQGLGLGPFAEIQRAAVNESGRVVGYGIYPSGTQGAFVWDDDAGLRVLQAPANPPAAGLLARAVSDDGTIVGNAGKGWKSVIGVKWNATTLAPSKVAMGPAHTINDAGWIAGNDGGAFSQADPPTRLSPSGARQFLPILTTSGYTGGWVLAMNNVGTKGEMAGVMHKVSGSAAYQTRAAYWSTTGSFKLLPYISGAVADRFSYGQDVNEAGVIVGSATLSGKPRAVRWSPPTLGVERLASLPGGDSKSSGAFSVSNEGIIVGFGTNQSDQQVAVIWDECGCVADLNARIDAGAGWTLLSAHGTTDSGLIVGVGLNGSGDKEAFLLTPLDEQPLVDSDMDSLYDHEEVEWGTDPLVADTDGDGLSDGREVHEFGTDPLRMDTDYDGLSDGAEVDAQDFGGCPSPLKFDSDGDGLGDGMEVAQGLDPCSMDSDEDGLTDALEAEHGTNPLIADSDGDGLNDGTEVDMSHGNGCPSPLDPDSDEDGLIDGDEVSGTGASSVVTDPCSRDTDGDTIPDGIDPLPVDPGGTEHYISQDLRDLADYIAILHLGLFDAPNPNAAKGRRSAIANQIRAAAGLIDDGDAESAMAQLESILLKLDGEPSPKDWMVLGTNESVAVVGWLLIDLELLAYL